jgi:4-hydroxyphenylacetate decarboxylase small subunit
MVGITKKHNDCENFCSVDVAKGICRLTNEWVFIDSKVCGEFEETAKCRNCKNFKNQNQESLGTCTGLKIHYWTAGETRAALCEGYEKNTR